MVNVSDNLFEFFNDHSLFDNRLDFLDSLVLVSNFNDLLVFSDDFLDLFNNDWHFNDLLHDVLDISVDIDDLRNDLLDLNNLGNFDHFLLNSFNFVDFRNGVSLIHYLFDDLLSSYDLLDDALDWNDFLNNPFDFLDLFSDIGYLLHDFFVLNVINDFFFDSGDFFDLDDLFLNRYDFFHDLWDLNNLLDDFGDGNDFFNYFLSWDWDLDWNDDLPFNFDHLRIVDCNVDDFLHLDVTRNFLYHFDNFFNDNFVVDDLFFVFWNLNKFINNSFNDFLDLNVYVFGNLHFHDFVLNHWNLNNSFNFFNFFLNDDLGDNPFHDLRNLNDFLNNSRNDDNFLYDFLDLYNFGNLDHLFDDFLDWNFNFLYPVNVLDHLNNLFLNVFDGLWNINVMVYDSLDFDSFWLLDDDWISEVHFLNNSVFDPLDNWLFNYLLNCDNSFMNNRDLNNFFDLFDDFSHNLDRHFNLLDNFLNAVLDGDLFNYSFNLFNFLDDSLHCHHFFDDLRNFNNSFYGLDNGDWSFDNSVHNFISYLNMVFYLLCSHHFFLRHNFLDNLLHFNDFGNLNNPVNYFLHNNRDLSDNLDDSLSWDNLLNYDLYLLKSSLDVVHNFLDFNNPFNLDWSFFNPVNNLYFWNLLDNFHDPFDDLRNFNHFFDNPFDWDNLLNDVGHNSWNFQGNIHYLLDLSDSFDFDNLFDDFLHWDDLWDLNDSINDFLHNLLHFDYLWNNSKDFQDVININDSHNLLVDHANYSFVDFEDSTCFSSQFFEFLQEGFDKDSQVELNPPGFLTAVGVDVFNFDNLWNIFDDFDESVNLVDLNDIDELLLEELGQSHIHLIQEFGILAAELLHLDSKQVDQMLGPCVLDWNFNSSFAESFQVNNVSACFVN